MVAKKVVEGVVEVVDKSQPGVDNANKSIKTLGDRFDKLGNEMLKVDKVSNRIQNSLAAVGAIIAGPLTLAVRDAADRNAALSYTLMEMQASVRQLNDSIGEALLPLMQELARILKVVVDAWLSLDPAVRNQIVTTIALIGATALLSAGFLKFVDVLQYLGGALLKLIGAFSNLALGMKLLLGATVLFATAYVKNWFNIRDKVREVLRFLEVGIRAVIATMTQASVFLSEIMKEFDMSKAWEAMKKGPKEYFEFVKKSFSNVGEVVKKAWEKGEDAAKVVLEGMAKDGYVVDEALDTVNTSIDDMVSALDNLGKKVYTLDSFKETMLTIKKVLTDLVMEFHQRLTPAISDFFFNIISGTMSAKNAFFAFAKSVGEIFIRLIADLIARWLAFLAILAIGKLFGIPTEVFAGLNPFGGSQTKHSGGVFVADAPQGNEGMAKLRSGEYVVNAEASRNNFDTIDRINKGMDSGSGGGGGTTINPVVIIQAWDTQDVMRNRKTVAQAVTEEIRKNMPLRETIARFT